VSKGCEAIPSCARRRAHGFSLVELIVFIVVVGLGLAGVLAVLNMGVFRSADPLVRKQALMIAEQMLEEILLQPIGPNPGTCTYATRAACDDVDDYGSISDTPIRDLQGNPVPGLESYYVKVSVEQTTELPGIPATAARRVLVQVSGPAVQIELWGYRAQYD